MRTELPEDDPHRPGLHRFVSPRSSILLCATAAGFAWPAPLHPQAAAVTPAAPHAAGDRCCPVVELRQYTLHPGTRDSFVDLFERKFIESQEAVGMRLIAQFRDLGDPNRFVWLRGFPSMPARADALNAFYHGPIWKANRDSANASIVDSDNVLLLRPARAGSGFAVDDLRRPSIGAVTSSPGLVVATVYFLDAPADAAFLDYFEHTVKPMLAEADVSVLSAFVTEESENTFPALPVRAGENVLVWFARFPDADSYALHMARLAQSSRWRSVGDTLAGRLRRPPEVLRLSPTSRSLLHD